MPDHRYEFEVTIEQVEDDKFVAYCESLPELGRIEGSSENAVIEAFGEALVAHVAQSEAPKTQPEAAAAGL